MKYNVVCYSAFEYTIAYRYYKGTLQYIIVLMGHCGAMATDMALHLGHITSKAKHEDSSAAPPFRDHADPYGRA